MAQILIGNRRFGPESYETEQELEKVAREQSDYIFGPDTIYLDLKRIIGNKNSSNRGIPDAYLIDFSDSKDPHLYFVEVELASHDVYGHISEQIVRFFSAANVASKKLRDSLLDFIHSDLNVQNKITKYINRSTFHNIGELMVYLTEKTIRAVVVIDEATEDLKTALSVFRTAPDIVEIKKFSDGKEIIYAYDPMREEFATGSDTKSTRPLKVLSDFDTVVCPALEKGFNSAYIEGSVWWAIRLSQEAREKLKYLAIYQKTPIGEVRHVAEIDKIELYKNTGKYIVYLKNKRIVGPIKLDGGSKGVAPQGPRFTTYEKLKKAKKLSDLWK